MSDAVQSKSTGSAPLPCPICQKIPGTKVGPPAMARCITPGCFGRERAAETIPEWNARIRGAAQGQSGCGEPVAWRWRHPAWAQGSWNYQTARLIEPDPQLIVEPLFNMPHAASIAYEPSNCGEPRFFIDHGMIHDRQTGKHVTTEPDSPFNDGILRCCELLNALAESRETKPFPLLFNSNWLEDKIKSDPDVDCEAGSALSSTSRASGDEEAPSTAGGEGKSEHPHAPGSQLPSTPRETGA